MCVCVCGCVMACLASIALFPIAAKRSHAMLNIVVINCILHAVSAATVPRPAGVEGKLFC